MLKLVLFLQVLILILFAIFGFFVYQEGKVLTENLNDALIVIDEVKAILPKLDLALDSINQLQTFFDSLESLSEILSILTNPFSSGDQ
jgi:predicted PurR-regulated permease PerM